MSMMVAPYRFVAAALGPTSTQWRVRLPSGSVGWSEPNIFEIEMLNAVGGTDQCNGGTAFSSSDYDGSHDAAKAFDNGASGNPWAPSTGNATSYIGYTFGSAVAVPSFKVTASGLPGPKRVILEYYDGVSAYVVTYDSVTDLSWLVGGETKTFTPTAPAFSVAPSITSASGYYDEGDTLTGVPGTHDGISSTYKWTRDGADIVGATTTSYTLVSGDVGHVIRFVQIASNGYATTSATSSPTATIGTPSFTNQSLTLADASSITLADSSDLETAVRTA